MQAFLPLTGKKKTKPKTHKSQHICKKKDVKNKVCKKKLQDPDKSCVCILQNKISLKYVCVGVWNTGTKLLGGKCSPVVQLWRSRSKPHKHLRLNAGEEEMIDGSYFYLFLFSTVTERLPKQYCTSCYQQCVCGMLEGNGPSISMISCCFYDTNYARELLFRCLGVVMVSVMQRVTEEMTLFVVSWHSWYKWIKSFFVVVFLFVDFFPPLQPVSSRRCPMLSILHLFMFSWLRGRLKTRERNHWSASQCLCLCLGFHRSLFPRSHNCFSPPPTHSTPHS